MNHKTNKPTYIIHMGAGFHKIIDVARNVEYDIKEADVETLDKIVENICREVKITA